MQVVWIASYPRSGNTWLRFLLYTYFHGEIKDSGDVNAKIPPIHRPHLVDPNFPGRLLVKTHYAMVPQHPYLPQTTGFIYIYRHPRDVLLSNYNYVQLGGNEIPFDVYARAFCNAGGDPLWLKAGYKNWFEHIRSWTEPAKFPNVTLRYEDLKADTVGWLGRIVAFLGEPADAERVRRAVELCDFEKLKKLEQQEKDRGSASSLFPSTKQGLSKGRMFMNKGESGRRLDDLAPGMDALFNAKFAPLMSAYGYT